MMSGTSHFFAASTSLCFVPAGKDGCSARRFVAALPSLNQSRCACAAPPNHTTIFTGQPTYIAAFVHAETRAHNSYYPQHICDADGGFRAIDEGDYGELIPCIRGRTVPTVPGKLDDSY